jgi:hypothetical protein
MLVTPFILWRKKKNAQRDLEALRVRPETPAMRVRVQHVTVVRDTTDE